MLRFQTFDKIIVLLLGAACLAEGCGPGLDVGSGLSLSPSSGPIGTLVTFSGSNAANIQSATVGGVSVVPVNRGSSTFVALVMPGATSGSAQATLANGTTVDAGSFNVTTTGIPATQKTILRASDNTGAAKQGLSSALSSDGLTAIVGGSADNGGVGAAWIFRGAGTSWQQVGTKLVASSNSPTPAEGSAVALNADGTTAIVGGNKENSNAGAAWIYVLANGTWTRQARLDPAGGVTPNFGGAVALSADGNTALIGGRADNGNVGAAWVFVRSGTTWGAQGSKLVPSGTHPSATFGCSVALSADGNTALIGGYGDNSNLGGAWVFVRQNGTWSQQQGPLVGSPAGGATPSQGTSVALSADGNVALSGANSATGGGAAWVFTRSGTQWSQVPGSLTAAGGSSLGDSAALSADGTTAVLGDSNANGSAAGGLWIFSSRSGSWVLQSGSGLVGTGTSLPSLQGISSALSADGMTALSGAFDDNGNVGATWVFTQ